MIVQCPMCPKAFERNAPNHIYCSRTCAIRDQRRRREARSKGMTVTAPTVNSTPVLSKEAQRLKQYWDEQAEAAKINGMTLDEWIADRRLEDPYKVYAGVPASEATPDEIEQKRAADMGMTIEQYRKWLADHTETVDEALKATGYSSRPATPTEEKKHEEGKED